MHIITITYNYYYLPLRLFIITITYFCYYSSLHSLLLHIVSFTYHYYYIPLLLLIINITYRYYYISISRSITSHIILSLRIYVWFYHLLYVPGVTWMNWVVLACVLLSFLSFALFPEHYARLSVDQSGGEDSKDDAEQNRTTAPNATWTQNSVKHNSGNLIFMNFCCYESHKIDMWRDCRRKSCPSDSDLSGSDVLDHAEVRHVEIYMKDMGMTSLASAWACCHQSCHNFVTSFFLRATIKKFNAFSAGGFEKASSTHI